MNFLEDCPFIDKSGFDINMRPPRGLSVKGISAIVTTTSTMMNRGKVGEAAIAVVASGFLCCCDKVSKRLIQESYTLNSV